MKTHFFLINLLGSQNRESLSSVVIGWTAYPATFSLLNSTRTVLVFQSIMLKEVKRWKTTVIWTKESLAASWTGFFGWCIGHRSWCRSSNCFILGSRWLCDHWFFCRVLSCLTTAKMNFNVMNRHRRNCEANQANYEEKKEGSTLHSYRVREGPPQENYRSVS